MSGPRRIFCALLMTLFLAAALMAQSTTGTINKRRAKNDDRYELQHGP